MDNKQRPGILKVDPISRVMIVRLDEDGQNSCGGDGVVSHTLTFHLRVSNTA